MLMRSKLFLFFLSWGVVCVADTQWTGTSGTIPTDDTYYINTTIALTGTLTVPTGALLEIRSGGALRSDYTIEVTGGTLSLLSGGSILNAYNSSSTGNINISGGAFNQNGGSIDNAFAMVSTGNINISGGTFNLNSGILRNSYFLSSTGNINVSGGTLNLNGGSLRNGNDSSTTGNITVSGGTLNLGSGGSLYNGYDSGATANITVSTGVFILGDGDIVVAGSAGATTTIFGSVITSDITSGSMTNAATMTIPSLSSFIIDNGGTLINNSTINNNETLLLLSGGIFTNNGTLNGEITDWTANEIVIENGQVTTISPGLTLSVEQDQILNIKGELRNLSSSTLDIYGTVYTYSYLTNGGAGNAGTINIGYPGELFLLGGTLTNSHASSAININSGGSLYNYYGAVDIDLGDLSVNVGGKFHNVRGNSPNSSNMTLTGGCEFLDSNGINLDRSLDIDYTWTLTGQSSINGYGNKITLGDDGVIIVDQDGALLFEDITIENISGNKIRCIDSANTVTLDNVVWIQDADYTFTQGKFYIAGDWTIKGEDTVFTYSSSQESTIAGNALIKVKDATFRIVQ